MGLEALSHPLLGNQHLTYPFQTTVLFDDNLPYEQGLKPLPAGATQKSGCGPERAILELASDIGKGQPLEEASNLMVSLRNLRADVPDEFLRHYHRVKVVRLVRRHIETAKSEYITIRILAA